MRRPLVMLAATVAGGIAPVLAQPVRVAATVDRTSITTDDLVRFEVEVVGVALADVAQPSLPTLDGLVAEQSLPVTIGEETTGQAPRVVFRWVLRPTRTGPARIGPAAVRHGGAVLRTNPLTLTVRPGSGPPPLPADPDAAPFGQGPPRSSRLEAGDVVLRASASTLRTVVGAQVVVEYRLFARPDVDLRFTSAGAWNPVGFWREDLTVPRQPLPQPATLDGRRYSTIVVQRTALFPAQSGRLEVPVLTLKGEADVPTTAALRGPRSSQPFRVTSGPLRLTVEGLDAPAGFSGLVGTVQVEARLENPAVLVGQAARLRVRVSGDANLASLLPPRLALPDSSLEVFEPQATFEAVRTGPRLTGTRTFTYEIVPHRAGTFALPPVRLVVYDVAARQFRTVHADPGALTVAPGDGESAPATGPPEASRSPSFKARPLLLMLGGLLVLVAGGLLWTRIRRQAASPASPVRAQPPKPTTAPRPASGLDAAEAALGVGDARRAATLAAQWLDEVLSRRLGRDLRRMSPEERDAALTSLPHAVRLRDLRFRLDAARFAPVPPDGEALRRDLEMLRTIVNEVGSGGVRRQGQA